MVLGEAELDTDAIAQLSCEVSLVSFARSGIRTQAARVPTPRGVIASPQRPEAGRLIAGPWSEFQRPRELPLSRIRQRGHAVCSTVVNGLAPAAESPPGPLLRAAVEAAARFMSASGAAAPRRGCLVVLLYYRTLLGWVKSLIRGRMFVVLATFP